MLPLTLFLAKLIGLLFLVFSLLMAMNKRAMLAAIDELVRSRGLMLIAGSFNFAAGLEIVLGHNVWSGGALTVVVTSAGWYSAAGKIDDALMVATITTNLMGPICMTSALIEHLKGKSDAVVAYTNSVLGFVPLAATAVYSSTKAAVHSYILSQRFLLRDTTVRVPVVHSSCRSPQRWL